MAIRTKKPWKKTAKPFVYFKGTVTKGRRLPLKHITEAFEHAGVTFPDKKSARDTARQLKANAVDALDHMKKTGWDRKVFAVDLPSGESVNFRVFRSRNGKVLLHQHPVMHGVRRPNMMHELSTFESLKKVLETGFEGKRAPNVERAERRKQVGQWAGRDGITRGDRYAVEIMAAMDGYNPAYGYVKKAEPEQIARVNVEIDPKLSKKEVAEKKRFYRKHLKGTPFHFV